jgi:hypothetical protein
MRIYVELAKLADFQKDKKNAEASSLLTKNLLPSVVEHFKTVYQIYSPVKNVIKPKKCGTIADLGQYTNKLIEGDFFLFVTAVDKKTEKAIKVIPCVQDSTSGRTLAAELQINVYHKDGMKTSNLNSLYEMTIRGVYRALAFDSNYFKSFVKPGTTTKLGEKAVVKTDAKSKFKKQVILKPVVDYAKSYYKCKTLTGMPLENKSGAKTQWEKSLAANDIMGSAGYTNPTLSKLTLAFMQGTGWFKPNMDFAENFTWGKGAGCDLFSGDCKKMKYTCKENTNICSPDFTTSGMCEKDAEAESCPFFHEKKKGDCRATENLDKTSSVAKSLAYGPGSRCVVGKIGFEKTTQTKEMANCLKTSCKDAKTVIVEVEGQKITCTKAGEQKKYKSGSNRYIKCPNPAEFCSTLKTACPKDCNFTGRCLASKKCLCFQGFKGADCSTANPQAYVFLTLKGYKSSSLQSLAAVMLLGLLAMILV